MANFWGLPPKPNEETMMVSVGADMDEQTRQVRFESMRKSPGLRKLSSNKKLFVVHKDLQKQCDRIIRRHEFDVRINTALVRREQNVMERRREKLLSQQRRLDLKTERTHTLLDELQRSHRERENAIQRTSAVENKTIKPQYVDVIRAIDSFSMPQDMKDRLRFEYCANPIK